VVAVVVVVEVVVDVVVDVVVVVVVVVEVVVGCAGGGGGAPGQGAGGAGPGPCLNDFRTPPWGVARLVTRVLCVSLIPVKWEGSHLGVFLWNLSLYSISLFFVCWGFLGYRNPPFFVEASFLR